MTFQEQVDRIHSLGVVLPLVEWIFIFIPIMFHAVVGWLIISGAMPNTNSYPYASNIRYTLQRATGIIAFFFIVFHVIQLHHLFGAPFKEMGGAAVRSRACRQLRRPWPCSPLWIKIAVRHRHAGVRLSLCQRAVDAGHHLGHLDQRRRAAPGQLGQRRRRRGAGRRSA